MNRKLNTFYNEIVMGKVMKLENVTQFRFLDLDVVGILLIEICKDKGKDCS